MVLKSWLQKVPGKVNFRHLCDSSLLNEGTRRKIYWNKAISVAVLTLLALFLCSIVISENYAETTSRWGVSYSLHSTVEKGCKDQRQRPLPYGSEPLPRGIVQETSNLEMRPLWGVSQSTSTSVAPKKIATLSFALNLQEMSMESESLRGSGRRGHWTLILILIVTMSNGRGCKAADHVVGADRGWDPLSSHNFQDWASSKNFRVGDNLWFAYSSAMQSVAEVKSREEWETCDVSNPIRLYNGGLDSVPLHSEGSRYFVSGRVEDCLKNGMKLHINVLPFNSSSPVNVKVVAEAPKSSGMSVLSSFSFFCVCACLSLSVFLTL